MLDDVTNPVAFTSVPLGNEKDGDVALAWPRALSGQDLKGTFNHFTHLTHGTESFYIVQPSAADDAEVLKYARARALLMVREPTPKTPEEMLLENESLRASLDALSKQAQALSVENAQLRGGVEKRDEMMKSVVLGVRREVRHRDGDRTRRLTRLGTESQAGPAGLDCALATTRVHALDCCSLDP